MCSVSCQDDPARRPGRHSDLADRIEKQVVRLEHLVDQKRNVPIFIFPEHARGEIPLVVVADWRLERRFRIAEDRSEEHTSELQSLMRISYAVFCLKKKKKKNKEYK